MIEVTNLIQRRIDTTLILQIGKAILAQENRKDADVSVVLVGEKKAKKLNKLYRGKEYAPNVLAFPIGEFGLGEIVLCPSVIQKEAQKYGIMWRDRFVRVFIHGMLHLLGYNHDQKTQLMEQKENLYTFQFISRKS